MRSPATVRARLWRLEYLCTKPERHYRKRFSGMCLRRGDAMAALEVSNDRGVEHGAAFIVFAKRGTWTARRKSCDRWRGCADMVQVLGYDKKRDLQDDDCFRVGQFAKNRAAALLRIAGETVRRPRVGPCFR
jgi:hypothetical protein